MNIVLLSDDAGNRREAEGKGVKVQSVRQYVASMPEDRSIVLSEIVAQLGEIKSFDLSGQEGTALHQQKTAYAPEYLAQSTLQAGIQAGNLHQGYFNLNSYNYREGSVKVPAFAKPILLIGSENMNRSVTGDSVVVEVFDASEWKAPADEVLREDSEFGSYQPHILELNRMIAVDIVLDDNPDEEAESGIVATPADPRSVPETARIAPKAERERQPTGRIVGVTKRGWRSYVCHLDRSSMSSNALVSSAPQSVFALPLDRKIPKIRLRTRQVSSLAEQKFLVAIDSWRITSRHPEGHLVRALGKVESKDAEIESLLLEHDVPYRPFSKAILKCLPAEGDQWVVPPKTNTSRVWTGREDLRKMLICSIDPVGCQDIDDALHARHLKNGNIEAGVRE